MIEAPLGQYADSVHRVLRNAEAMAIGYFGHENWVGIDVVTIVDSHYDPDSGACSVTVEGPVNPAKELNIVIPKPLSSVMASCMTACDVNCCGLDAFDIQADSIRGWAGVDRLPQLLEARQQIDSLIDKVRARGGRQYSSGLHFTGDAGEWLQMFSPWIAAIDVALNALGEPSIGNEGT